jgi:hypothetical protein
MNDRPTKEIKTPVLGATVILKEWITGREQEYIQEPIINAASFKAGIGGAQGTAELSDFKVSAITQSSHRAIETVVVSVNGQGEKILDEILNLHKDDYEFVMDAVNEILKKKE